MQELGAEKDMQLARHSFGEDGRLRFGYWKETEQPEQMCRR
jgi:hypothetical protein